MQFRTAFKTFTLGLLVVAALPAPALSQAIRWPADKANAWYAKQPWLVGSNYLPASAINQLEMWQKETFDAKRIDLELGWAQSLGMNTMRVFLHDLLWSQDSAGFKKRIDTFLTIAAKHNIKPVFVFFDSCWDPGPVLGKQHEPTPGVHNSGWVQSPGAKALEDPSQEGRLQAYVTGVVRAYANDERVLAWDIWNEPDNGNSSSYGTKDPSNKKEIVLGLLPKAFDWARAAKPSQPLTSGVWAGHWGKDDAEPINKLQLELSDVVSFHNYGPPDAFNKRVESLKPYGRPLICTEYMARGENSTFEGILPIMKDEKIAAINWGFVAGKSQTFYPWDSWKKPYVNGREPAVWFHDIFKRDGQPYKPEEVIVIRKLTGVEAKGKKTA